MSYAQEEEEEKVTYIVEEESPENEDNMMEGANESILETSKTAKFSIGAPKTNGNHVTYLCNGVDSKGEWSG